MRLKKRSTALANEVFPESTWPNIPTETLQSRPRPPPRLVPAAGGSTAKTSWQSVFMAIYIRFYDFCFVLFCFVLLLSFL